MCLCVCGVDDNVMIEEANNSDMRGTDLISTNLFTLQHGMSGPRPGQPGGQFSTQDNPKIAPPPKFSLTFPMFLVSFG